MVEEQLVNGDGQINIGRHPPLGEIRGMGSCQHRQSLTAGTSLTVPFSLIFIPIHAIFHLKAQARRVQILGFPFFVPEEQDRSTKCLTNWISCPGQGHGLLEQGKSFGYLNRRAPLRGERKPKLSPNFSTQLVGFILVTPNIIGIHGFQTLQSLKDHICMVNQCKSYCPVLGSREARGSQSHLINKVIRHTFLVLRYNFSTETFPELHFYMHRIDI